MLRIQDKDGNLKFILSDEDTEPVSIDELIRRDVTPESDKDTEENSNDR